MIICTLVAALPAGNSKRVSEGRGKRASSTRERSASEGPILLRHVARLVLGGSRATYRLRLPITPSLFFEGPFYSLSSMVPP